MAKRVACDTPLKGLCNDKRHVVNVHRTNRSGASTVDRIWSDGKIDTLADPEASMFFDNALTMLSIAIKNGKKAADLFTATWEHVFTSSQSSASSEEDSDDEEDGEDADEYEEESDEYEESETEDD